MTEPRHSAETPSSTTESAAARVSPPSESKGISGKKSGWQRGLVRFVLAALYILFLAVVVLALLAAMEYYAYMQVKASPVGQAYKNKSLELARQSSQVVAPQYGYEPTPGFVAVRDTHLGNSYEYINDENFKDFESVPLEKPDDEYRIIVTGGSVVYGRGPVPPADRVADFYEVTFRWNIPHLIQEILNADPRVREKISGKKVRAINAGVPGYVYQNNLMRYLAKLRLYRPDLVVALDGANEVHTVARPLKDWNYFSEGQYFQVVTDVMDMGSKGLTNYLTLWLKRNTYFFTWLALRRQEGPGTLMEEVGIAAHPQDATPEMIEYRNKNIAQVADVAAIYHKTLETDRVPHVLALQPMFRNCKKKRTPMEDRIEAVTGMQKVGFYDAADTYNKLVEQVTKRCREENFEVADLTGIFDSTKGWVFTDWCHLTNGANYVIAKELANLVKTRIMGLPLEGSDILHNPPDSYLEDYSKDAKVLVNNRPADEGLHILKGYPGANILEVAPSEGGGARAVVLDLGSVVPISRLRIVWADDQAVPAEWRLEMSEDGKAWKDWISVSATRTDGYDQWPGYEHYSRQEMPARYVRYVPSGEAEKKAIRLRQLSLFR
ncbi:MAG: discoidin domain-containing protein [Desulfomonile tiedjei]|nr:discoidin domain-containing protein [Desulfomonile tiedjei]